MSNTAASAISYGQFCPMARALELVGERWTLLVVRELLSGSTGFNQIRRGLPAIAKDTLSKRLRQLCASGLVEQHGAGTTTSYSLTNAGTALAPVLSELAKWSTTWDRRGLQPEHLDPDVLLWDIQRRINFDNVPAERTVIEFSLTDRPLGDRSMWLIVNNPTAELCTTDGGYDAEIVITTTTETLSRWWIGDLAWSTAVRSGDIKVVAPRGHRRSLPDWFLGYALL